MDGIVIKLVKKVDGSIFMSISRARIEFCTCVFPAFFPVF